MRLVGVAPLPLLVLLFAFSDTIIRSVARRCPGNSTEENKNLEKVDQNCSDPNSTHVLGELLNGYDPRIRPGARSDAIKVRVDMFVANIWAMEEVKMEFTIDLYLRQYWRDERLVHQLEGPLTLSSGINKQLWLPSTYFLRAKLAYFHDVTTDNYLLQIQPDGSIFYSVRLTITVACNLDLRKFPHDTQTCSLSLESYGYQDTDVSYIWNPRTDNTSVIVVDSSVQLPQFELISVGKETAVNQYNIGNHSSLIAKFVLKRRVGYYLIDTYIPSTIIVVISWISFWIDPDTAPARVALGITTVLTMTTLISSARASLPKVSYVKAIDWYLLLCLIFVFGSILEYTFVTYTKSLYVRHQKRRAAKMAARANGEAGNSSKEQSGTFTDPDEELVPKCSFRRRTSMTHAMEMLESAPLRAAPKSREPAIEQWCLLRDPLMVDKVSRFGFPVAFIGFNCIYWLVYSA